ncbi:double-stranded RNA-specific editase B2-like isoform X1 [Amphibalanus amphitrite]|uniref:double-stranded RNA-specific editase B2-like isoform X1 n=2 Tax=Amphibalanus amphitrite TaxID=1232801 RepID=UPI001C91A905|nr:double-stranded RNA-specific editase B2-like isoform X1 [Amphibalanus amphitrite]XP_043246313.1 double-stranded RNA-specific editase B2-like isoform X1 [Amphibalanus amphitrite]XP_043246314.1 double-stranded RNA-specific editase B2-like isoform X1 [Amphibalanus amphitrite]XP_043246315.1 double-stranded RNA-specific editase B2-like isoform X1 [Amphibalanus amphitrite]XP_043246316.1 double-stranded RNA-specific editase B2-like isoform X1 [Amphibalanus amphitrite]XP_043246317.1 double-stranded
MAYRYTRTSVRTSKPAQQHLNHNFVSGGSVPRHNSPLVQVTPTQQQVTATQRQVTPTQQQVTPTKQQQPAQMAPAAVKPEANNKVDKDGDVAMNAADSPIDLEQFKAEKREFFLKLKKASAGVSKKDKKQLMQRKLRKQVAPKNATVVLQEIRSGVQYQLTPVAGATPPMFTAVVEVDGKQYQGMGSNKALARAAAAERALQSFVPTKDTKEATKPATEPAGAGGEQADGDGPEDTTPWSALASFALHKLFCDWRQGRVGTPLSVESAGPPLAAGVAPGVPTPAAQLSAALTAATPAANNAAPAGAAAAKPATPKQKPAKTLPTDAASRHAVMLLHEMRPTVTFEASEPQERHSAEGRVEHCITMTANVDGQQFTATARNKKEAKRLAAEAANTALFGLQYAAKME